MHNVEIRRCPVCSAIGQRTTEVAATLEEHGITADIREGDKGEFSVLVDGQIVAQKYGDLLPATDEIVEAVREQEPSEIAG